MMKGIGGLLAMMAVCACGAGVQAGVVIDTVPVGNPGNPGELSGGGAGGWGDDRVCGAVDYTYRIAKHEVTAEQYTEFLNAVAGVDTYNLYNTEMWTYHLGCQIERYAGSGTPDEPYQYRVAADRANRPVNCVGFWDACRFVNWLYNGQPTGAQGAGTTETGTYTLNGYNGHDGREIQRNAGATWALPTEDEWYKAAYHKNDGVTGNYWDYPMGSDAIPSNSIDDTGNSANFMFTSYTIGAPYWRTEVGYFGLSESPYGTFDQGGNVFEWNESVAFVSGNAAYRVMRGGSYLENYGFLRASARNWNRPPLTKNSGHGFRVCWIPEPATIGMLALAGMGLMRRR